MRVLITGAAGYIGRAVVEALRTAGHTPVGLAHSPAAEAMIRARGGIPAHGDLRQPNRVAALTKGVDAVIHAATTNGTDAGELDTAATRAMLRALDAARVPFVYTSGVWVLGETGEHPVDETAAIRPTPLVAWREALEAEVTGARGVHSVVLRPGIVFGDDGGIPAMLGRGELLTGWMPRRVSLIEDFLPPLPAPLPAWRDQS